ncbi:class I SAM-dependent methyltransferase [Novipirellula sp. SH528]|uniref:class I SAM-dependent methyltransferase n=1 Tax=Novipirellula sp. SH528 TaxID=3454466 RepID=UPI003FA00074
MLNGAKKRLLHVAPEPILSKLIQAHDYIDYLSADLVNPKAMVKMDLTEIEYPNNSFDVVYCSHVLEHIPDDRKAMREIFRVLRRGGWAILQVPITSNFTFEDATIQSPEEREKAFGHHDHVRRYGQDYRDRLVEAGFSVEIIAFARELEHDESKRLGLILNEDVYLCTKFKASC